MCDYLVSCQTSIRWRFVLQAEGTRNKMWTCFRRPDSKVISGFAQSRCLRRAAESCEVPSSAALDACGFVSYFYRELLSTLALQTKGGPPDLSDLWRRVKRPRGRQRCHIQGRRKPHQDIRKAGERSRAMAKTAHRGPLHDKEMKSDHRPQGWGAPGGSEHISITLKLTGESLHISSSTCFASEKSQILFNFSSYYFVTPNLPVNSLHAAACTCVRDSISRLRASPDVHRAFLFAFMSHWDICETYEIPPISKTLHPKSHQTQQCNTSITSRNWLNTHSGIPLRGLKCFYSH